MLYPNRTVRSEACRPRRDMSAFTHFWLGPAVPCLSHHCVLYLFLSFIPNFSFLHLIVFIPSLQLHHPFPSLFFLSSFHNSLRIQIIQTAQLPVVALTLMTVAAPLSRSTMFDPPQIHRKFVVWYLHKSQN